MSGPPDLRLDLAADAWPLAVVGLVAAGLELALLGLLAHRRHATRRHRCGSDLRPSSSTAMLVPRPGLRISRCLACAPMENLGLVGFTGAGANRLFSALTGLPVPSEYEAAVGIATRSRRAARRSSRRCRSRRTSCTPGFELVHLALPPGAKPGEGLGAKVLGSLRNCDAILIVLRAFDDSGIEPDPAGDLDALELELVMADLTSVEQRRRAAAASGEEWRQGDRGRGRRARTRDTPRSPTARRCTGPISVPTSSNGWRRCSASPIKPTLVVAQHRREGRRHVRGRGRARRRHPSPDRHRSRDRGDRARGSRRDARDVRRRGVGARAPSRARRTTCSAGARSSRPATRSRARGPSGRARRRRSVRA